MVCSAGDHPAVGPITCICAKTVSADFDIIRYEGAIDHSGTFAAEYFKSIKLPFVTMLWNTLELISEKMDGVLYFYYADKRVGISFETEILANQ
jgi:hypothetical protein